jgi:hypothetical protein
VGVPGTAGLLPPGPPSPGTTATIRVDSVAAWHVTLLGARTSQCNGDLWLLQPSGGAATTTASQAAGAQVLWTSYLQHLGESTLMGPYPAGAEVVFGLKPASYCTEPGPSPSTGADARIATVATNVWDIWWEDWHDSDYDDLVVRVEAIPLSQPAATTAGADAPIAVVPNYPVGVKRTLSRRHTRRPNKRRRG